MKINRKAVFEKYKGHCAYCGREICFKKFQVDHYWPQYMKHHQVQNNNHFNNLMPSCARCNNHKHSMSPETWRSELAKQVTRLTKNAQFDRALRFGQIQITECPIVFYFERLL
jgi:5-methylcytosine-specific restriction endonuclease McrA